MFQHLSIGGGFEYYACPQRVEEGLKEVRENRKQHGCFQPPGDDVRLVMNLQAKYMFDIKPCSRA